MQKTLSRAGNSIREGLGEYFGITDKYENTPRSYYVENQDAPNSPSNEPYWMKEKFWEQEEGGIDLQAASAPPMDGVTVVIPNSGYDEPPPAYHDLPQGYTGGQQAYIPQFVPANVGAVPTADAAGMGMGMSMEMSDGSPYMNGRGRGGRGRGRGRGRGAGGRGRGRGGASGGGPRSKGKAAVVQPPQYKPYFIMTCTIIDVVLIVWEIILNGGFEPWSVNPWFGPSTNVLLDCGAKYSPKILAGEWWRFISPMFLHVGLGHLLMNMLMQVRVGVSLEKSYGAHRIVPIYLICGIMGNLISAIMLPDQVQVGASGALYGFMGVLFADLFQNWGLIQSPMKNLGSLIITTLISLGTGLVLPGVDNFAHLGGGIMGVLTGFVFLPTLNPAKKGKKGRILTVAICLPLMVFMFVALFIVFYRQISASEWCHGCQYITCIKALSWCRAANT